jgi:glycosyltransferase involved in cell wall biosynthesis
MIEFLGEIDDSDKGAFLGDAMALLFPIDWPEPFGLVLNTGDRLWERVRS